jgi:hypothetical protein
VCAYSLSYVAWNAQAPYDRLWPHYVINATILEKNLLSIKCVFLFSLQLLSETVHILSGTGRDMIKIYIGLHVKYPLLLSDFNETWIFWTDFRKILKYKILWKSFLWETICCTRKTDTTKVIGNRKVILWTSLKLFNINVAKLNETSTSFSFVRYANCWEINKLCVTVVLSTVNNCPHTAQGKVRGS